MQLSATLSPHFIMATVMSGWPLVAKAWVLLFATVPTTPYWLPCPASVYAICMNQEFVTIGLVKEALIFHRKSGKTQRDPLLSRPAGSARMCYVARWKVKRPWHVQRHRGWSTESLSDNDKWTRVGRKLGIWGKGLRERIGEAGMPQLPITLAPQNEVVRFHPIKTRSDDW